MFSITCTPQPVNWLKEEDLWCFDYTFPNGTSVKDEPLMPDATELVNRLIEHKYGKNWWNSKEIEPKVLDEVSFYDQATSTVSKGIVCADCLDKDDEVYQKFRKNKDGK